MGTKRSKITPKYKTKYKVTNWRSYDRALVQRGDVTMWMTPAAIAAWTALPSGEPGGQRRFSDVAIETALFVRLVFGLPWRQTEGFLNSQLKLMGLETGLQTTARCRGDARTWRSPSPSVPPASRFT